MAKTGALEVHPVAALFPMLPDDELKDLAADIKANGLQHPIVMQGDVVIDGRNRLVACEMVKVEPSFEELNGQDPTAYILSANLNRRHLTKSQRAVMAAKVLPEVTTRQAGSTVGVSNKLIGHARLVLAFAPDLADAVLDGSESLNDAYAVAQDRKAAKESAEARMDELRSEAPDLADQVIDERLTLSEALGAYRARGVAEEATLQSARSNLERVLLFLTSESIKPQRLAEQDYGKIIGEYDLKRLQYAAETMEQIVQLRKGK